MVGYAVLNSVTMFSKIRRIKSLLKREYSLNDYLILTIYNLVEYYIQENDEIRISTDWKAEIYGWEEIFGTGTTEQDALRRLEQEFERYRLDHGTLPKPARPTVLLSTVHYSPVERIHMYTPLIKDFFPRILNRKPEDCWISELSTMWHFIPDYRFDEIVQLIYDEYGVDISDIEGGNLLSIFDRLSTEAKRFWKS